jgi:uncharacterized protein YecE (DUF72 family)
VIYVGTCGFSYRDWIGPFYPPKTRSAEMLPYYAGSFPAVEIDSSYYAVPDRRTVESMASRTPPGFRFSFKTPQTLTHAGEASSQGIRAEARALLDGIEPAVSTGKLACVLAQFPNGLHPSRAGEERVRRVVEALAGVPVVVEFRNREWQRPETLELLRSLGAGYCNVDAPRLERLPAPSSDAAGAVGYVRFHGRNAAAWWRGTNVTRYDYLYSPEELVPWTDRIAEIEAQTRNTYVFFNNHANGQAPRNAELMESLLERRYGPAAAASIVRAKGGNPEQTPLPGMSGR